MTEEIVQPHDYAPAVAARIRPKRNPGRRILFFRWYGIPSNWRAHLRLAVKHLRSAA